ncbi:unnamed protein product [Cunninghamella echinulata]
MDLSYDNHFMDNNFSIDSGIMGEELFTSNTSQTNDAAYYKDVQNETANDLMPISHESEMMVTSLFNESMLLWLSPDYTVNDHIKFMIKNNFKKFVNHCITELDSKWRKENLLDNVIIPDAIVYLHNVLKKPISNSQKRSYFVKRRMLLEELFNDLGYTEFRKEIIKKVYANDPWTNKNGGGPPKSWWVDVARWIRLDHFKNQS